SVAMWLSRDEVIRLGTSVKVPEAGSNNSAVLLTPPTRAPPPSPPASRTFPLGSSVAVWRSRSKFMPFGSDVKVPEAGSNSSAVFVGRKLDVLPPAIRTLPLGSRVAVWLSRAEVLVAGDVNRPQAGSNTSGPVK